MIQIPETIIDHVCRAYEKAEHPDQLTIDDGQFTFDYKGKKYELYADCRFVHNSYYDHGREVTRLVNFYFYDLDLYYEGDQVLDGFWAISDEYESEIFNKIKS